MSTPRNISSQFIIDNIDFIKESAVADGKIDIAKVGVGLSLSLVLRLCGLMNVRARVWRSMQQAAAIPAKLRDLPDVYDLNSETGQIFATADAMCKRLRTAFIEADQNIEQLCEQVETMAETMAKWPEQTKSIAQAIALLDTTVEAARNVEWAQSPNTIADEVQALIQRASESSKEIGKAIATLQKRSDEGFERISESLTQLENSVARVDETTAEEAPPAATRPVFTVIESSPAAANDETLAPVATEAIADPAPAIETTAANDATARPAATEPTPAANPNLAEAAANLRNMMSKLKLNAGRVRC